MNKVCECWVLQNASIYKNIEHVSRYIFVIIESNLQEKQSKKSDVNGMAYTKTRETTSALGRREEIKGIIEEALEILNLPGKKYLDEVIDKVTTKVNEKLEA